MVYTYIDDDFNNGRTHIHFNDGENSVEMLFAQKVDQGGDWETLEWVEVLTEMFLENFDAIKEKGSVVVRLKGEAIKFTFDEIIKWPRWSIQLGVLLQAPKFEFRCVNGVEEFCPKDKYRHLYPDWIFLRE